jgi:predicted metal-dependent hydrolase
VQLSLPLSGPPPRQPGPVVFVRHRRARRYILRVLADGTVRVTLPRWGVKRDALAFVETSRAWIAQQLTRRQQQAPPTAWAHGTQILIDGRPATLRVESSGDRRRIWCDDVLVGVVPREPISVDAAACSADRAARPSADRVRAAVTRWLLARARRELPPRLQALANQHGIVVPRVSIRDQRSRWGACSPTGTITLNWRLVQTPAYVRDYVLLHELMHRRELNHSRRFWRLVAAACPGHAAARRWLRKEGKQLWADGE